MRTIKLNLKKHPYKIIVGSKIMPILGKCLSELGIGDSAYVITNARIKNKYSARLHQTLKNSGFKVRVKTIPDTEKSKSLGVAASVIQGIADYDKRKRVFIIAFGGGVIGDLAGFVASIYKRGIPYMQLPTTLLAQVDSAIGGKTAVDLPEGKNLAGAFYQPRIVFSDIGLLKTLDQRQIRSGLSEVIKYGVIKDARLFSYLEKRYKDILNLRPSALEYIVRRSSQIKANIVQGDEREERGLRTILNFGHTVGHAIETAAGYKLYNHGEAIALGMLIASDISKELNLLNNAAYGRIERLIRRVGLPSRIRNVPVQKVINAHYRDKKFIGQKNRFVLISEIGRTKIVEDIPIGIIKRAIKRRV